MIDRDDLLFARIEHSRTADEVIHQIELLILEGVLRDGDRLPGERDLSQKFDISRPILREALKELEARGLLVSHHGGGTFVADIVGQVFSRPLADLITRHERAARDYLDYRRELEAMTAGLAARRATETDRMLLARIVADMRAAHDSGAFQDELTADVEFHTAVGEAAHNIVLMHTLRACYRLLSDGIFFNRKIVFAIAGAREKLLAQHIAIHDAIAEGDEAAARMAATRHIDFIIAAADDAAQAGEWNRVSRLRLMQRENRPQPGTTAAQKTRD